MVFQDAQRAFEHIIQCHSPQKHLIILQTMPYIITKMTPKHMFANNTYSSKVTYLIRN